MRNLINLLVISSMLLASFGFQPSFSNQPASILPQVEEPATPTPEPTKDPGSQETPVATAETPAPTPTLEPTPTITPEAAIAPTAEPPVEEPIEEPAKEVSLAIRAEVNCGPQGQTVRLTWEMPQSAVDMLPSDTNMRLSLPKGLTPDLSSSDAAYDRDAGTVTMRNLPKGELTFALSEDVTESADLNVELMSADRAVYAAPVKIIPGGYGRVNVEGGKVDAKAFGVQVEIPAKVFGEETGICIGRVNEVDLPYSFSSHPVQINAYNLNSEKQITHFDQQLVISMSYDPEEIGEDEENLSMFYYDSEKQGWYGVISYIDPVQHILIGLTDHLSVYDYNAQSWQSAHLPTMDSFQVAQFTGAATYSYPIQVPAGPGGWQPSLALTYNSQVVDNASSQTQASWVGMGWSLDTGYISRDMKGTEGLFGNNDDAYGNDEDYKANTPGYTGNDGDDTFTLNLNGQSWLLLRIPDTDSDPKTIDYRTADESFLRIRRYHGNHQNNGYPGDASYWEVWDKTGNTYYFEDRAYYVSTPSECAYVFMQTWQWSLTRARNMFGKEITYSYTKEYEPKYPASCDGYGAFVDVAVYPATITYPNSSYRISFERSGRYDFNPAWSFDNTNYPSRTVRVFFMRSRLAAIKVEAKNVSNQWELVRRYDLGYETDPNKIIFPNVKWQPAIATSTTLTLASITEVGSDGQSTLPVTSFTYGDKMHLTEANNGYGGKVIFTYEAEPWHETNRLHELKTFGYYNPPNEGCTASGCGNPLAAPMGLLFPGQYYMVVPETDGGWSTNISVGVDYGTETVWTGTQPLPGPISWTYFYIKLPANASESRFLFKSDCPTYYGHLRYLQIYALLTRYRVIQKEITAQGVDSTVIHYSYGGAASNDANHSAAVSTTLPYYDPYLEFRGHSVVTETVENGIITTTYYNQDDQKRGRPWKVEVRDSGGQLYSVQETTDGVTDYSSQIVYPKKKIANSYTPYTGLNIFWIHQDVVEQRKYEGGSTFVGTKSTHLYSTGEQGGAQYGNLTNQTFYTYKNGGYVAYKAIKTTFWPNASSYLVGLPGRINIYDCPNGACDFADAYKLVSMTRFVYDNANNQYYNAPTMGILKRQRVLLTQNPQNYTDRTYADQLFNYDEWGNVSTTTVYTGVGTEVSNVPTYASEGPQPTTTTFDPIYHTYPVTITNALGQTTTLGYDYRLGVPTSETDPNGATTTATYDTFGRITSVTRPGDDPAHPTMIMDYHDDLDEDNPYFWTQAQQRIDASTTYKIRKYYNGLGQLLQTQVDSSLSGQMWTVVNDTYYDSLGRVSMQAVPYSHTVTTDFVSRPASPATYTLTSYDVLGRVIDVRSPDMTHQTATYTIQLDNTIPYNVALSTDAKQNTTVSWSDTLGRAYKVVPPTGPGVTYTYDPADRLTAAQYGPYTTTLTYDIAGRKLSMNDPDMGNWVYSYDALGNLKTQTDARGCVTTLSYDLLNRLTGKSYSNASGGNCASIAANTSPVTYTYDQTDNGNNGIGRRTAMNDGSGSSSWTYDARGRVTSESKTITNVGTFALAYTYNSADLLTNVQHPTDTVGHVSPFPSLNYSYLPQMTLNGMANYVSSTSYDEAGRMISRVLGNGKTQTYTYYGWTETSGDNAKGGLLKSIQVNGLQNLSYQYDAGGNITKITDAIAVQDQTFTYDSINRLTSAQATGSTGGGDGGYNETYGYDSATGNLNSKAGNNYTYGDSAHPHAATQMGSNSYSYDSNGNMTTRTSSGSTYSLGYDAEGRMTSVSGATTAAFVYDGDGNRVKSTIGTQTVAYIGPRVEYNITTNTMTRYYLFGSERIAMRVLDKWKTPNETNTIYYTLSDHLGSASIMTDTSGNRKTEYRYKAWGEDRYTYFASGTVQTAYQYTGQRNDPGMGGLLFYNARWYDSYLNRFAQADSIIPGLGNPLAWDRYAGMANNPLRYNDPTGHWICSGVNNCEDVVNKWLETLKNGGDECRGVYEFFMAYDKQYDGKFNIVFWSLGSFSLAAGNVGQLMLNNLGISTGPVLFLSYALANLTDKYNYPSFVSTFAHEMTHLAQGALIANSIVGEMGAREVQFWVYKELGGDENQIYQDLEKAHLLWNNGNYSSSDVVVASEIFSQEFFLYSFEPWDTSGVAETIYGKTTTDLAVNAASTFRIVGHSARLTDVQSKQPTNYRKW